MSGEKSTIRTFRCVFYISAIQLATFFLVPAFVYPPGIRLHVEVMAALTFGLIPGLYFLIVNLTGIFIDRARRRLHVSLAAAVGLWFAWAAVSWAEIEHMHYLLH